MGRDEAKADRPRPLGGAGTYSPLDFWRRYSMILEALDCFLSRTVRGRRRSLQKSLRSASLNSLRSSCSVMPSLIKWNFSRLPTTEGYCLFLDEWPLDRGEYPSSSSSKVYLTFLLVDLLLLDLEEVDDDVEADVESSSSSPSSSASSSSSGSSSSSSSSPSSCSSSSSSSSFSSSLSSFSPSSSSMYVPGPCVSVGPSQGMSGFSSPPSSGHKRYSRSPSMGSFSLEAPPPPTKLPRSQDLPYLSFL
eukprot:TRINITY_DN2319_c0_g2_i2.p1 TRINITY_DN2319_c0_g2~~TRINITY_DN2319_c0_g2_i2.p1  ORF type:complete len:277 (-),score=90.11 TRINITY_DN2319_c0_g2_i2:77-820(-)